MERKNTKGVGDKIKSLGKSIDSIDETIVLILAYILTIGLSLCWSIFVSP
jgi:uncharacterized membrane protein